MYEKNFHFLDSGIVDNFVSGLDRTGWGSPVLRSVQGWDNLLGRRFEVGNGRKGSGCICRLGMVDSSHDGRHRQDDISCRIAPELV